MLKCRGKHVCRRICAKSVRLVLEPYSRYLISRGYSAPTREVYVRAVEYFGRWLGRRRVGWSQVAAIPRSGPADLSMSGGDS